jgi:hypothetical protein
MNVRMKQDLEIALQRLERRLAKRRSVPGGTKIFC